MKGRKSWRSGRTTNDLNGQRANSLELVRKNNQHHVCTSTDKPPSSTEPSENWDDDFLFGSASAESLPLPTTKNTDLHNKKPGSAQSTSNNNNNNHPSRSYPRTTTNTRPRKTHNPDPTLVLQPSQDSLTPRKTRPRQSTTTITQSSTAPPPPAHLFNTSRSSPARCRPALSRPPASAPPSRGQSVDGTSSINPTHQIRVSHLHDRTPSNSYPYQAISSQNSVPSISDLSSIGFRSPSSSLSMTDDSRGDWSHSSGDHSARFRGTESGNLSFNTETEFTEPDIELDWAADDTDHENHRTHPSFLQKPQQAIQQQPFTSRPLSPSSAANLQLANHQFYHPPISTSINLDSQHHLNSYSTTSSSPKQIHQAHHSRRQSTHAASIISQSTSTSTQTSRSSKKNFLNNNNIIHHNLPAVSSPSATSSSSSVGYYQSNCSDLSLNSPTAVYSNVHPNLVDSRHPRQAPIRTSSCSSSCSGNLGYYHSGSESYDPATSGTETDGLSDHFTCDDDLYQSITSPSSSDPNRNTPTVCQRSRKQALYSRPSYASPSPGSSLTGSISTSTLNASECSLDTRIAGLSLINTSTSSNPQHPSGATEDEKSTGKNPSRRRFRRKRPSTLLLNKATGPSHPGADSPTLHRSPTTALSHKASSSLSGHPQECSQPGDLAFAADSDAEERRQSRSSVAHRQAPPVESRKRVDQPQSHTPPRIPLSGYRGLNTRSRSTINRPHTSTQVRNENKQCLSPPDTTSDDSSGKIFNPKRPLSFTALFSRGSTNSTSAPPVNPPMTAKTSNQSQQLSRSCFKHRYSTSIDSNTHRLGSSPNSHTSNDSILSRVRRLSSRPAPHPKNSSPISPTRKRFSLAGDTSSRRSLHTGPPASSGKVMATPLKAFKAANDRFSTALKSNRRQTSQSDSFVSDVTLTAVDSYGTVRARRPSSRASCSNSSIMSSTQPSLTRKFSIRSNNKSSINEPDLCHSPTDNHIDHDLASATQSRFPSRRTLPSKPPKSNPALRARAEANAQLQGYRIKPSHSSLSQQEPPESHPPATNAFDVSPTSSAWGARYPYARVLSNPLVPNSEPLPTTISDVEHDTHVSNHLAHIGNLPQPTNLTRSNSMGELRIPSRITSQQGRLQTELNQVKEFARGIDELKTMRRTYRKMIRATHHSKIDQSIVTTDESDVNSSDSDSLKEPEPLPDRPRQEEVERSVENPNQVSPRALERLYTVIQKIQEEYKEWWTCCNVLIDLGEGSKDPRNNLSSERLRSLTSYSQETLEHSLESVPPVTTVTAPEAKPGAQKHFEILKSMFAPGGAESTPPPASASSSEQTSPGSPASGLPSEPVRCQTPPMAAPLDVDSGDKTPISRPVPAIAEPSVVRQLETPTPAPRKVHSIELASSTMRSIDESQADEGRLSDWSEIDATWNDTLVDKLVPKSAPAIPHDRSSSKLDLNGLPAIIKDKRKAHSGRYSSYHNHHPLPQPSVALGLHSQRPRVLAGSRIGISGIKDFLKVLKARVHAEEKWPIKRNVVPGPAGQNSLSVVLGDNEGDNGGFKRGTVRSQKKGQTKKAGNGPKSSSSTTTIATSMKGRGEEKRTLDTPGSVGVLEQDNLSADQSIEQTESVSSSEEECWDELFGFNQNSNNNNNNTTTTTSESLDLALPPQLLTSTLAKKKLGPNSFGAASAAALSIASAGEARLALSSDRMPQLLSYLNVVKDMCAGCLDELKSQTV
ncbi:hypothetical protein PGT21_032332 [Puccinia graminis f. sp. tritici]|uniref:Uncharacterized protein n=1 Tax=Puccinia graminis f. sp. tritici TaxID=56615 RepID=A0A5B0Q7E2_PUCGR|nr:hypothetical protein PGT21_032332 [Puccinia graminis f. sp. tritici]